MSSSSDSQEDVMIALACNEIEKRTPRFWIHEINLKRETYGEFYHLFPDLLADKENFFKYFRMSSEKFYELVHLLNLKKQDTNFRKAIPPEESLAVTLNDGGVFSSSQLGKKLHARKLNLPENKPLPHTNIVLPHVIVADEAFPLLPNLMRPYPGSQTHNNEANKIYNYRHSARRVSENAFGILSKKFRIFFKKFNISPDHLDVITLACTALHNFLRNDSCAWQPGELEAEETHEGLVDLNHIGR
ncbi:hypothetical protein NQ314_008813 [Rhamnusium bicolor]|uniref:DDE Tnp4 domain-containing protein n=1 Tax=Rhamnusium bicolor TaxID=1586634 RepID=A0AAV8Y8C5_9CUCU|nr:hypothetical protein NQ314_008813 [Rhamnusium bicolor]